jgi:hypothetical protein
MLSKLTIQLLIGNFTYFYFRMKEKLAHLENEKKDLENKN